MPAGNPLAYFGNQAAPQPAVSVEQSLMTSLLGTPVVSDGAGFSAYPEDLLAAGVKGKSLPAFRYQTDAQVLKLQKDKNEKNRAGAIKEENIRHEFGTWGIPGNTPVEPQIG